MNIYIGKSMKDAAPKETRTTDDATPEKACVADASANGTAATDSSFFIPNSSFDYYRLGNKYRREGNWQEAINNYIAAIELDPNSPAVEAKQMLDDILGYYNKDMYNP